MPTTTYYIKFIGHLKDVTFLPADSPELTSQVETEVIVEVDGLGGLKQAVETHLIHIMRTNSGMVCRKNPGSMKIAMFVPDEQYFVPIHMISHITTVTKMITGQVPDEAKKGNTIQ